MLAVRRRCWSLAAVAALWPGVVRAAASCPDCAPVRAARAAIREDPEFWSYLLITASPFLVVVIVAVILHRTGGPTRERAP